MGELIDFKSKKIINKADKVDKVDKVDKSHKNKKLTIQLLEGIIKDLKKDKLNPEKCLVIMKWANSDNSERYEVHHNDLPTETSLSMLTLSEDLLLRNISDN